jgi:hypothetical protein
VIVLSLRSPSDASLLPCFRARASPACTRSLILNPLLFRNGGKDADDGHNRSDRTHHPKS